MLQWTQVNKAGWHFSMKEKTKNGNEDSFFGVLPTSIRSLVALQRASGVAPPTNRESRAADTWK